MRTSLSVRGLRGVSGAPAAELQVELTPQDRKDPEAWLFELQSALRPGGMAYLAGRDRRLARIARHYFDVETNAAGLVLKRRTTDAATSHFESLAPTYWSEIPAHIQEHFFRKKIKILEEFLPGRSNLRGLDLGCGVGRYAADAQKRLGGTVTGLDPVRGALRDARSHAPGPMYVAGDVLRLPFKDAGFDYVYTINMLHHLKRGEQERGLREMRRVLRPGGVIVVHEMNVRNPVFRWYLRALYPKLRPIDRGDEEFIDPRRWPLEAGLRVEALRYMTFVPDFAPHFTMRPLLRLEAALEKGRGGPYSIHYAVVLRPD